MTNDRKSNELKDRLGAFGLSDAAIEAVWPTWWSEEAEVSPSAVAELRLGVARRLGIDPRSLLGRTEEPRFLWGGEEARFKQLASEDETERNGIASFGRAVASILARATPPATARLEGRAPAELRKAIIGGGRPFVDLASLLTLCWGVGVPVAYLRVFPWPRKRMAAMTVRVGERPVILLGRDSEFPAQVAFYLAHELGHIGNRDLAADEAIVDLERPEEGAGGEDEEERAADRFALELLTGYPEPEVRPSDESAAASPSGLAQVALMEAGKLGIEPGTLALCFGYSTGDWPSAIGALKVVYAHSGPAWQQVNMVASSQLGLDEMSGDGARYLAAVLGTT